jgi:hypothetical protein
MSFQSQESLSTGRDRRRKCAHLRQVHSQWGNGQGGQSNGDVLKRRYIPKVCNEQGRNTNGRTWTVNFETKLFKNHNNKINKLKK